MSKLKSKARKADANFKLPEDLTPEIEALLSKINSNPRTDYLLEEVFSKFVSQDTDPANVRRQRAINKWLATEMNNEATNERLMTIDGGFNILPRVSYDDFMDFVRNFIVTIIGEVVPESVLLSSFSSGASTSRGRASSHASGKYIGKADVTNRALHTALIVLDDSELWSSFRQPDELQVVDSNILFTVPKKTDIDRCACKEPDINMYLQKGVGRFIRNGLRRVGINLNDQSRNQSLARIGSRDSSLATLDLSSASDSVCTEFVFQALPALWFSYLDDIRCHSTIIDGEVHVNQMFSSMGNGFTFELESLLFFTLAKATAYFTGTPGTISVYGDDIIVPSGMYHDLVYVLSVVGFSVNTEKSFSQGTFRESCGGHYDSGRCVTPFYIREPVNRLQHIIVLANAIRKWSVIEGYKDSLLDFCLDDELYPLWKLLSTKVPRCFWGGYDLEDTSRLVSAWKPNKPRRLKPVTPKRCSGDGGYLFWHNSKELAPEMLPFEASLIPSFTGVYKSTKVGWDYKVTDRWFLDELTETETI